MNVIPSTAEATLDIRALPDEDMPAFYELMRKVIDDPSVQVVANDRNARPGSAPSRIDTEIFHAIEAANRKVYQAPTIPQMSTGATDMAFLRAKGMQCYGVGPVADMEDAAKGFGAPQRSGALAGQFAQSVSPLPVGVPQRRGNLAQVREGLSRI